MPPLFKGDYRGLPVLSATPPNLPLVRGGNIRYTVLTMLHKLASASTYTALARGCVYLLVFLLPLFFLPVSLDVFEVNKQTLLILLTFLAALAWVGSMVRTRTFIFRGGWLNFLPLVLLVLHIISAFLSKGSYLSWAGTSLQEFTSVLTLLSLVMLFYITVNTVLTLEHRRTVFTLWLISATLAAIVGILSMVGVYWLPFDFARVASFNTIGTLSSLGIFLVLTTVLANALWVSARAHDALLGDGGGGIVRRVLIITVSLPTLFVLTALDYPVLWLALLAGLLVMFIFALLRAQEFSHTHRFTLPFFLTAVAVLFFFWLPSPFSLRLPVEVGVSMQGAWGVARQSLHDSTALFGNGPGTFMFEYARYHPIDVNQTQLWNVRFDRPASFAMNLLISLGVLGAIVWLVFLITITVRTLGVLVRPQNREEWFSSFVLIGAWAALLVVVAMHAMNLTLVFSLFLIASLLAAVVMPESVEKKFAQSPRAGLIFSFLFVLISIAIVSVVFITAQRYLAEVAFAKAVRLDRSNGQVSEIASLLDRAARYNRFHDLYARNLSQALLLRVAEELRKVKDVNDVTPEGRQYIQALASASINAAVKATDLSPNNVLNWTNRGAIYREIVPLDGSAGDFAVAALTRALELEPNNPAVVTELGKTHLIIADAARQLTTAQDPTLKAQAEEKMNKSTAEAEARFNEAIMLKADYAPAHYQLAVIFERQGKLNEAVGKMESIAQYNPLDVGVGFQLGLLYLRRAGKGDLDRARQMLERVIELAPSYSNARWFLASIYEQQGNVAAAASQVEKVAELNPDNELVRSRLDRLRAGTASKTLPPTLEEGERTTTTP